MASPHHEISDLTPTASAATPHNAPHVSSLLESASRVAGAAVDLEELALHWDYLPLAVRHVVMRHMADTRLRLLERLLLLPAHNPQSDAYDAELQGEWRRRCRAQGLHVDTVISSDTLFRDAMSHPRDPRRVFWEHRFRSVLRTDTTSTIVTPSGDFVDRTQPELALYEDVVEALKVNARELVPRNVAWLLKLHRLRRVELHHPADHHKETLARGLEQLLTQAPALQELGFFHGRLSAELLTRLAAAITKRQQLIEATGDSRLLLEPVRSVEFVSVKLKGKQDHVALVQFVSAIESLESVRISSVIADFENRRVLDALLALPRLTQLSLEHNDLEDGAFAGVLTTTSLQLPLRRVRLGSNAITSTTMQTLSRATRDGVLALERLEVRNNQHIGDAGVHALAPMLLASETAHLTHLDLRNCHFGLDSALTLLTALGENATLKSLDMSQNFFGSSVGDVVADFLLTNHTLERLHVNYVGLGLAGCTARLQLALRTNQSLRVLSVGANRLRDHGAALLTQAIAVRSRTEPFEALDLSGNLITSDGLRELARALGQKDEEEGDRGADEDRPTKRQRLDSEESAAPPLLGELGLLNNDLQGRGEAATRTRDALAELRRFVGKIHSNEWSSRRNVYDDEV